MTRRLLLAPCLACQRAHGEPMCELCADLEEAEERSSDDDDRD